MRLMKLFLSLIAKAYNEAKDNYYKAARKYEELTPIFKQACQTYSETRENYVQTAHRIWCKRRDQYSSVDDPFQQEIIKKEQEQINKIDEDYAAKWYIFERKLGGVPEEFEPEDYYEPGIELGFVEAENEQEFWNKLFQNCNNTNTS